MFICDTDYIFFYIYWPKYKIVYIFNFNIFCKLPYSWHVNIKGVRFERKICRTGKAQEQSACDLDGMWLSCEASLDFVLLVDPRGSKLWVKGLMEKLQVLSNSTCNLITHCFKENNLIIQKWIHVKIFMIYVNNSFISQVKYKIINHYKI